MTRLILPFFAYALFVNDVSAQQIIDRFSDNSGFALGLGEQRFLELFRAQFPNLPNARIKNIIVGDHAAEFDVSPAPGEPFKRACVTTLLGGRSF